MKKISFIIAVCLAGCSAPKFASLPEKQASDAAHANAVNIGAITPESLSASLASVPADGVRAEGLASATVTETAPAPVDIKNLSREQKKELKKQLREMAREIKAKEKLSPEGPARKKDAKSGFAIAGFVCSIVGLFVLWPLCVLGIIFSAIGLKSDKKGLAIAGLVIGIVGVVLVLAIGAAFAGA